VLAPQGPDRAGPAGQGHAPAVAAQRLAARQRAELEPSANIRAENVMIVDLMRTSRVCAAGSVQVPRLLSTEPTRTCGIWSSMCAGRWARWPTTAT